MPHVRLSVRGPKMICFDRFCSSFSKKLWWASPVLFGPRTLRRTWGTRPVPIGFCYDTKTVLFRVGWALDC